MSKKRMNRNKPSNTSLKLRDVEALRGRQQELFDLSLTKDIIANVGCAGTGKTFCSIYLGIDDVMSRDNDYNRLVILRSQVSVRDSGHLPGTKEEKESVYQIPYVSIINELFGRGDAYSILINNGLLEFESTSFLQGTTFTDSIIVVDEFQNMTFNELDMVISRVGENCMIYFCGDTHQSYLRHHEQDGGFLKFLKILNSMDSAALVEFDEEDIVRSGLVKEYILARNKEG